MLHLKRFYLPNWNLSTCKAAGNTLRLIVPCFATGQAAGVAAAIAVKEGCRPREVPIAKLHSTLLEQDVYLGDTP